jgi:hypothetical protein
MIKAPVPAVSVLFWIAALSAEKVGVMLKARSREPIPPAMTAGTATRRRLFF